MNAFLLEPGGTHRASTPGDQQVRLGRRIGSGLGEGLPEDPEGMDVGSGRSARATGRGTGVAELTTGVARHSRSLFATLSPPLQQYIE